MIKIRYFARLSENLNCKEEDFKLNGSTTVEALIHFLIDRGPPWSTEFSGDDKILVALNHEMCSREAIINSGDEVGFFPPVTGG